MRRPARYGLIAAAVIIVLILIATVAVPQFVNADAFRARIEDAMSQALGRKVTIGDLHVSVWSGSLVAENATIADDSRFSSEPFVQAKSVQIGVEMFPLIFRHALHVRGFVLESPKVQLLRAPDGTWNYSSLGSTHGQSEARNAKPVEIPHNLTANRVSIQDGQITLGDLPAPGTPTTPSYVYQKVNAQITGFTPTGISPFTIGAELPGGGALSVKGKIGPLNPADTANTPLDAQVSVKSLALGQAGLLPPDAGIHGLADLDASVQSNGQTLTATGKGSVAKIQLAKDGQPSAKPLQIQFDLSKNEQAQTGEIKQATLSVGRAVMNIAGAFQTKAPTTILNLKVNGNAVPIDDIEAFLPSLGIHLPEGSRLQGGTLTTSLAVTGSTANPAIQGPVRIDNTRLAGFNLGSKLQTLSQLTGGRIGNSTGADTTIRSLSMNVAAAGGAIKTDNIALDVPSIGTATGAGTVSQSGALAYNMLLKLTGLIAASSNGGGAATSGGGQGGVLGQLSGMIPGGAGGGSAGGVAAEVLRNGVPVVITGTTSHPAFTVNTSRLATSAGRNAVENLLNRRSNQSPQKNAPGKSLRNALGGLLGGPK